jgi:hypothetical protein
MRNVCSNIQLEKVEQCKTLCLDMILKNEKKNMVLENGDKNTLYGC